MAIFTNQAQLSYDSATLNSNVAIGEIRSALTIEKTVLSGPTYGPGDTVVYQITVSNAGNSAVSGLKLTDSLGSYAFQALTLYPLTYQAGSAQLFLNGVLQGTPTVSVTQPLIVTGLSVPANGTMQLIYRATVNQYAPLASGGQIQNVVSLTGCALTEALTASATVTAESGPSLIIAKSMVPVPVMENGTLTYTFVILNTGNTAATEADLVAISDLFSPILHDITVSLDGAYWTAPARYTYNESTGQFHTVPGQITVPAATYTQNATTGVWSMTPGSVTLLVSGTL